MPTPKVQDHTDSYSLELDASWEIDVWGKIKSQQQSELATYLQTSEAAKAVQTSLVADIANDYYDLLKLDKKLSVAQKNLLLSDTILRMTILRKEAGYVTQLAVQDAEVQRQSTALLIPQYEQQIAEMENALHLLLGEAPGQPIERITKLDNVIVWGNLPTSVPAEMVSNRPDVRKKEYAVIAADASVAVARKKMYPSLSISVSGGLNAIKASNWFSMPASLFATLTGSISQPILQHRELKTNYEVSQIQRNEAVINFKQATLDALGEVANALVSIDKLKTQRTLTTEEVATTQKAIVNAQFLFKSAEANYLEVTTAQGNALSAELDLADIQRQQLAAMIDLYQSLGGGWK